MARYRDAVAWIAENDGSVNDVVEDYGVPPWPTASAQLAATIEVAGLLTVALVADVFGRDTQQVARDVLREKSRHAPDGADPHDWNEAQMGR